MKKIALIFCLVCSIITVHLTACKEYNETIETYALNISLIFPDDAGVQKDGIRVELKSIGHEAIYVDSTDTQGTVHFQVPSGIYEASSSSSHKQSGNNIMILNGNSGQIIVKDQTQLSATINLHASKTSQLVIKELYNGGIMKDDGKSFSFDESFILYNNSSSAVSLDNLCVGIASPYNSQANNRWYDSEGKLIYESEGYICVWSHRQYTDLPSIDKLCPCRLLLYVRPRVRLYQHQLLSDPFGRDSHIPLSESGKDWHLQCLGTQ